MVIRQTRRILFGHLLRTSFMNRIITRWFRSIHAIHAFQHHNRTRRRVQLRVISSTFVQFNNHVVRFISRGMVRLIYIRLYGHFQAQRHLRNNRRMFTVQFLTTAQGRTRFTFQTSGRFLRQFFDFLRSLLLLHSMRRTVQFSLPRIRH